MRLNFTRTSLLVHANAEIEINDGSTIVIEGRYVQYIKDNVLRRIQCNSYQTVSLK